MKNPLHSIPTSQLSDAITGKTNELGAKQFLSHITNVARATINKGRTLGTITPPEIDSMALLMVVLEDGTPMHDQLMEQFNILSEEKKVMLGSLVHGIIMNAMQASPSDIIQLEKEFGI